MRFSLGALALVACAACGPAVGGDEVNCDVDDDPSCPLDDMDSGAGDVAVSETGADAADAADAPADLTDASDAGDAADAPSE